MIGAVTPRILAAGDTALLVELGDAVSDAVAAAVHALDARIAATPPAGMVETVPGLRSLLVEYDPLRTSHARLRDDLLALAARPEPPRDAPESREHVIAVRYDGDDLDAVARACGLDAAEVARIHAAARYRVAMVGNMPGLPYLLGLDPRLDVPRRDEPRRSVPAGAVAIAGGLSCVYPEAGPGGWNLLGSSDAVLFDPMRDPPSLLVPGDLVRFEARADVTRTPPSAAAVRPFEGPALLVVEPGLLTTVQDAGRHGLQRIGVPVCGALDRELLCIANALAGNRPGDAALEATHTGPLLEVRAHSVRVAVAGDVELSRIDRGGTRTHVDSWHSMVLRRGDRLQVGRVRGGLRCVVAVEGGVAVAPVLGSRSTCLGAHFGGLDGRALRPGDVLPLHGAYAGHHPDLHIAPDALHDLAGDGGAPIRVVLGPQQDACTDDSVGALLHTPLTVSPRSDRTGLRVDGVTLRHRGAGEILSDGCAAGSIQVPGSGKPIVLLADRGTTGGYPKVATVASVDLPRLARLRPGAALRFEAIDVASAERLRRERESALRSLVDSAQPAPGT
jgi:KipI family sensor histidine kinase inhibitor